MVDRLLTNFHVPRSSLLALVTAFVGPRWRNLYEAALEDGYRFLSLPRKHNTARVDYLGVILLSAATTCLILFTDWGGKQYAWTSPTIIGLVVAFVAAVLIFIAVEKRAEQPIIPMSLFKNKTFVIATVC